ncbi:hypothetical protein CTI12_AA468500 [Artemisia annua]|uniref:Uncharacterized protein n=1 Tax=Artemisia annua TaxID=35608 RepID=A0A2U1LPS9_ARTAN|nr:hypothetical protein CTI12_AA468500 [Artemisia annua]
MGRESLASPPLPSPNPRGTQYPLGYFGRSLLTTSFNDRQLSSYDRTDSYQDPVRSADGTVDLLARVGMGSGEDEENDGDNGDNKTES